MSAPKAPQQTGHPIEWATASFREAMDQQPARVTFDKWKGPHGEVFTCYVFPMTVGELDAITKARLAGGIESLVEVVLQRAKDAEGKRLFQSGHRAELRRQVLGAQLVELAQRINDAAPEPSGGKGAMMEVGKP